MKKQMVVMLAVLSVTSLPFAATAADPEVMAHRDNAATEHKCNEHAGHDTMEHGSMAMPGETIMLGEQEVDGVEAMVHLKDVKEAMSKMGMTHTHHFMVMFADIPNGEPVGQGVAAVKITDPTGKESQAIALMGMQGHFGADIALSTPGEYVFKLGTKLADGKKRQYEFKYTQP